MKVVAGLSTVSETATGKVGGRLSTRNPSAACVTATLSDTLSPFVVAVPSAFRTLKADRPSGVVWLRRACGHVEVDKRGGVTSL